MGWRKLRTQKVFDAMSHFFWNLFSQAIREIGLILILPIRYWTGYSLKSVNIHIEGERERYVNFTIFARLFSIWYDFPEGGLERSPLWTCLTFAPSYPDLLFPSVCPTWWFVRWSSVWVFFCCVFSPTGNIILRAHPCWNVRSIVCRILG